MSGDTRIAPPSPPPGASRHEAAPIGGRRATSRVATSVRRRDRRQVAVLQLSVLLATVLAWQLLSIHGLVSPLLVPPPVAVVSSIQVGLLDGLWWRHIGVTLSETIGGFGIGVTAGLVTGAVFAFVPLLRRVLYPFIVALQCFPKIAIVPVLIVALGYGQAPKVAISAILAFFPVLTATIAGLTEIDADERNLLRSLQATPLQELRYLRLPNAMSYIFPAMDVAIVLALLGAIVGEFVGARAGLGYLVQERSAFADTATIYGVLIVMSAIGLLLRAAINGFRIGLPRRMVPK